jgi:hypothetical protein
LLDVAFRGKGIALGFASLRPEALKDNWIVTGITERGNARHPHGFDSVTQLFGRPRLPLEITPGLLIVIHQLRRFVLRSRAAEARILLDVEITFSVQGRSLALTHNVHHHKDI